jgi:hypothetical protein
MKVLFSRVAAIIVAGTLAASGSETQTRSQRTRCIGRSETPLAQALRPDDEVVVIGEWAVLDTLAMDTKQITR